MTSKSSPSALELQDLPAAETTADLAAHPSPKVYMMDLWTFIPYYDGYICRSLRDLGVDVTLGAITYHKDREHFVRVGLRNDPGFVDVVSRLEISIPLLRQALKFLEFLVNSAALAIRFVFAPPDILHVQFLPLLSHGWPIELWFLRYAKGLGLPIVYTVHDLLPKDTGPHREELYGKVYRTADALICHNQATRSRLIEEFGIEPQRIWQIPHGPLFHDQQSVSVDEARARLGLPQGQRVVLWQGIVRRYKGVGFLLEAWARMRAQEPGACLVIAGSGEEKLLQEIRQQVRSLGIEASVRLDLRYLSVEEVSLYYQSADILVYPYQEITTSGALMTGLNYDKPIVATRLAPFEEALRERDKVTLVAFGDTADLAGALERLIGEPDPNHGAGNGKANVPSQEDPWAPIAQQTLNCYRSVLRPSQN